ncbi:hypothetical protein Kisp01_41140 [Kineosporia sp. NBRC 101677]|uniref:putative quinol monooxygenase n=1 Tax=Kineosporia sp. NBRC 101677 TaxID=3032197 RepID=UPI00249FD251|nr:putative quinol monooxygenase [Kineosporia sp. NBRC 101677]GLY17099.1 hypothetical protein Kisp01_41140 [Kineosporia sp. NBRC 101677]
MIALVVSLRVRPGCREEFLTAITANAEACVADEPGCVSFDITCDREDEDHFFLYEVYRDQDAIDAHRQAPHFLAWREVAARVIEPGSQVNHLADRLVHLTA